MAETRLAPLPRRRALALTPLVDVIFLLLLFFMLASSFARPAELELAGAPGPGATAAPSPAFVQLGPRTLRLNGTPVALEGLAAALQARPAGTASPADPDPPAPPAPVLVSLDAGVTAQRLVDLLAVLRAAGHPSLVLE